MDKRQRILIVDDAKLNRDILKEILGETYNYLEAENGNQAIQMIGDNPGIDTPEGAFAYAKAPFLHTVRLAAHVSNG